MRREESWRNQEMKIGIVGKVYSNILEDYQDGKIKTGKKLTLNEFMSRHGFYTERIWVACCKCGNLVTANQKHKKYCAECAKEEKKQTNKNWRENNKERAKKLNDKWRENNKERERKNNKKFKEQFDGMYIYFLLDVDNNIRRVGKTTNYYNRLTQYKNRINVPKNVIDFMNSKEFKGIVYANLSELVKEEVELLGVEAFLINTIKTTDLNEDKEEFNYKRFLKEQVNKLDTENIFKLLDIRNMREWV